MFINNATARRMRVGLFVVALGVASEAKASPGYCVPNPNCNAPLSSCPTGVAVYDGTAKEWVIDVDDGFSYNPVAEAVVVSNFQIIGTTYCNTMVDHVAWGTTRTGVDFFCPLDGVTVDNVELHGTPDDDDLCFQYANWGLEDVTTTGTGSPPVYAPMTSTMFGYQGDDEMAGSWDDTEYFETLRGGPNDDWMECEAGPDVCLGEGDDDYVDGGQDDDLARGGPGIDFVDGGDDEDVVCGDSGVDETRGGDQRDEVDGGGQVGDDVYGDLPSGAPGDTCGGGSFYTGCEAYGFTCP